MDPARIRRLFSRFTFLTLGLASSACISLVALTAGAGVLDQAKVPDPRFSSFTPVLVGCASGDAITTRCAGTGPANVGFIVRPRTVNDEVPIGHDVELHFVDPGLRLYAEQEPGTTFDCALRVLHRTVLSGDVVFRPRFGGHAEGAAIEVGADGVILGYAAARSTDLDAQGGTTGLGDFAIFAPLFVSGSTTHPEADFDGSGGPIGLGDFAIFAREFASGTQGSYCP